MDEWEISWEGYMGGGESSAMTGKKRKGRKGRKWRLTLIINVRKRPILDGNNPDRIINAIFDFDRYPPLFRWWREGKNRDEASNKGDEQLHCLACVDFREKTGKRVEWR